jgi:transcriptional regulator with XRE-family HTH domain
MNQSDKESDAREGTQRLDAPLSPPKAVHETGLGERMKRSRQRLGLSQAIAAQQTGIPLVSLKKYEGSKTIPGADVVSQFARLGVNLHWLLTGDGPMLLKDLDKQGPPPDVNAETLAEVIEGLEQALEERHLHLEPARKARAIGVLYDFCKKSGKQEPAVVERFLELMT